MYHSSRTRSLYLLALVAGLAACGDFDPAAPTESAASSSLSPIAETSGGLLSSVLQLAVGQTRTLAGCYLDIFPARPNFVSQNTSIATVTSQGVVTGVGRGSTRVVAERCVKTSNGMLAYWVDTLPISVLTNVVTTPAPTGPVEQADPMATTTVAAELPRAYVQVGPEPTVSGRIIRVAAGQSLQAALDAAQPGDHVLLAPGGVWRGNFVLRKKAASSSWIVVRPDLPAGSLPASGTRMTPSKAAQLRLPRIETTNVSPVLRTEAGAQRWRVIGLEVTGVKTAVIEVYNLTSIGDGSGAQKLESDIPKHIVFDRLYMHGNVSAGFQVRRCIGMHGSYDAVVDSWISECTNTGFDAQAVWGWNGTGPHRITNNYLEASGENVGFGGAIPAVVGRIPADIEIRGNHIAKPLAWKGGNLVIKNLVEFKNGMRVLIEGNLIENVWAAAQPGNAIVLTPSGESGRCPWCTVRDVTIRRNHVRKVGAALSVSANPQGNATPAARIRIAENIFDSLNVGPYTGTGRAMQLMGSSLSDVMIEHNTAISPLVGGASVLLAGSGQKRLTALNNLFVATYGIFGDAGKSQGVPTLDYHAPGWVWAGNVHSNVNMVTAGKYYPTNNFYLVSQVGLGLADFLGGDYTLSSSSPYKGKATDGSDPGANISAVRSAMTGVVVAR